MPLDIRNIPSHIARRDDSADLWTAFCSAVGAEWSYSGTELAWFVRGWDKAKSSAAIATALTRTQEARDAS